MRSTIVAQFLQRSVLHTAFNDNTRQEIQLCLESAPLKRIQNLVRGQISSVER